MLKSKPRPLRTTLPLDADVLSAARQIAAARSQSVGHVISELARRGLEAPAKITTRRGFPVFQVREDAPVLTPDDVRRAEDED